MPTLYTAPLESPYVEACARLAQMGIPELSVQPWYPNRRKLLRRQSQSILHLNWIEWLFRDSTTVAVVSKSAKFLTFVLVLRLRGVPIIWTVHNAAGKGHTHVRLDKAVRSILTLLARRLVVLNREVVEPASHDVVPWLRRRFRQRCVVVPHPLRIVDHGVPISAQRARELLGIRTAKPVVLYLPGAHQVDQRRAFQDHSARYELLVLDRTAEPGLRSTEWGWCFGGAVDDAQYGWLISAADAVVLGDTRAFGSSTLHACASLRRPVLGSRCPALAAAADIGIALTSESLPGPDDIATMLEQLAGRDLSSAFLRFDELYSDVAAADAFRQLYGGCGSMRPDQKTH